MISISIGCDHAGFELKQDIINQYNSIYKFSDVGCNSTNSVDYADYAHLVANHVLNNTSDYGILICGSGNGINMSANKHKGIRAALCWKNEITLLARQHNNANILVLPARFIDTKEALNCVNTFLNTKFEEGRHLTRINKIDC